MSIFSDLFGGAGRQVQPLPYHPTSPEGLAARWVRWVAGVGPLRNPVADGTGEHAAIDQPDDVWFLAGTFGGEVERRCSIPAGGRCSFRRSTCGIATPINHRHTFPAPMATWSSTAYRRSWT
jgi:hypothetical protein